MRVGRVPQRKQGRGPGRPNPSPALPATPVPHPGLEHPRPLPCTGASRGATEASQILARCPGLLLTSLGCPLEGGLKTGSRHPGTLSPCPRKDRRMSFRLRCTRYRQSRGRSLCPRMEATAALRSHPPATGGPLSVAWLHVCGVCVSVPGQGRCQRWACHSPRRGIWGLGTRGTRESSLSPRTPLAQSVVLETGPQPSPSTATFAPTPASLQGAAHHRSCQPGRTCANCGAGRPTLHR